MTKTKSPKKTGSTIPSKPSSFLHGVEVIEVSETVRPITTVKASVIGVIGTAPQADSTGFPLNTPVLWSGNSQAIKALGKTGTLPSAITGIAAQGGAQVVLIRVTEGESQGDTIQHLIGGVESETDHYTGVSAFLASQSQLAVTPRLLIAPGFTHQRANHDPNPVVQALLPVAESLRAIIIADGPNTTDQAAVTWRYDWHSSRIFVVDPWIIPRGDQDKKALPPSPYVAGLIARIDHEHGFWVSPSNQTLQGIGGLSRPVDFALGQWDSRANRLNQHEITTIIHQGGYRLWGNRTCSQDSQWAFLSVRRTADMVHESLLRAHQWAVDRNMSRTYVSEVTESVNAYLATLKAQGAIVDGACCADTEHNTPEMIASGKISFQLRLTPPYPAERIGFRSQLLPVANPLAKQANL